MGQHLIVTMLEIFLILVTVAFLVAAASAVKALLKRYVQRASSTRTDAAGDTGLCGQTQEPPGGT
jgi:hypothetical protein